MFQLYHYDQLDKQPTTDKAFGLTEKENERIVLKAIESIFKDLTSI